MLALCVACVGPTDRTFVTGRILPRQIRFVTLREATPGEEGGQRSACIHVRLTRANTSESVLCRFGVETPLHNVEGPISTALAQRIAADRINEATQANFSAATIASPLGMLCESVKATLRTTVPASIAGAKVPAVCHERALPVHFGDFTL
ncbi:hypothetical protein COCOR_00736 [Corallococcus coralloides DSM 2259]|uniref:Uncharacterized protein n=1 Tax=Corallococcus coralloides (strain ATCC 25202 / DSM 2259 / NBRC 100086 / M2) TaxID=1144275 RepID=H8MHF7_CORCM|nr:hypothetical protein COCOR_00736 [Corallococcus coralloides DSM 2259]